MQSGNGGRQKSRQRRKSESRRRQKSELQRGRKQGEGKKKRG